MNILFANKFFFLNGGSERVFFQEREFLINQGHSVIDFSMEDPRNFDSPYSDFFISHVDFRNGQGVIGKLRNGLQFIHSFEATKKIEQLVRKTNPAIAHLHNIYHQLTPSIIPVLKKHGVKVVLTLHDGKLICPSYLMVNKGKTCTACEGSRFYLPLAKRCQGSSMQGLLLSLEAYYHKLRHSYEGVDLFLAPSRFMADFMGHRIAKEKIRVLHNGIDVAEYAPSYSDDGYALYFGRLSSEKGLITLLEAHKTLGVGHRLLIVGTGPLADHLGGRHPGVEFLGYKSGKELYNIIDRASYVVMPTECYENCSMVVLESMALGKPVIGSRIGGVPEQIDHGKTGLLFEMGNQHELAEHMRLLYDNSAIRLQFGKAARVKLEKDYSLHDHCTTLENYYLSLLHR